MASPETLTDYLKQPARVTAEWWEQAEKSARRQMAERNLAAGVFIVITAQHPLTNGRTPGPEFTRRLTAGKDEANTWSDRGRPVTIYVPGSRHMHEGLADHVSLSHAGSEALHHMDLDPAVTVLGEEINQEYKGEDGVYNGGDEAYCAAAYFKNHDELGVMRVVCSPGQQARWELQAIANGVAPEFLPITDQPGDFHTGRGKTNDPTLIYTRRFDPTWQGAASFVGRMTRAQRKPPIE